MVETLLPASSDVVEEGVLRKEQIQEEKPKLEAEILAGIGDHKLSLDLKKSMFGTAVFLSLSLPMDLSFRMLIKLVSLLLMMGVIWWMWNSLIMKGLLKLLDKLSAFKTLLLRKHPLSRQDQGLLVLL
jgi:hypothetical protein